MSMEEMPFVLDWAGGEYVLQDAYPEERDTAPNIKVRRAVDSEAPVIGGDGKRTPSPVLLTFAVEPATEALLWPGGGAIAAPTPTRVGMAYALADALDAVTGATRIRYGPLAYAVTEAWVTKRTPTARGYKVTAAFIGPKHEFEDIRGRAVPLV